MFFSDDINTTKYHSIVDIDINVQTPSILVYEFSWPSESIF